MIFWGKKTYTLLRVRVSNELPAKVSGPRLLLPLRGVTFLEMLIVIAIVGIIALLTVPRFPAVIQRAQRTEAVHAMALIRNAELAYSEDYPGDFVDSFAGLPWGLPDETENFDYTINTGAGEVSATNKRAGRPNYRMNIATGHVTQF